jgi:hypothetical protein
MRKILLTVLTITIINANSNAQIIDLTVIADTNTVCPGQSSQVHAIGSQEGVDYVLRNSSNNIVDGPVAGDGNNISFNTGALTSTETFNVYGTSTNSVGLDFDGTNDYLSVPLDASFDYSLGYSFEAWVKTPTPSNASYHPLLFFGSTTASDVEVYARPNDFAIVNNSSSATNIRSYPSPPNNIWFHLAVTFDGATTSVYYDGVQQSPITGSATGTVTRSANTEMDMGGIPYAGFPVTYSFQKYGEGMMDDIRLWNTVRSPSEISSNITACLNGTENGLEGLFKLNDSSGSIAVDETGTNNGILTNMDPTTDWLVVGSAQIPCGINTNMQLTQTDVVNVITVDNSTSLNGITITANQVGATYQWVDCNNGNAPISGETGASFTPTSDGNYAVEITYGFDGCLVISACVAITGVGIEELSNSKMGIYPNPATTLLTIDTDEYIKDITVLDMFGAIVQKENTKAFSVENLAKGIYTLTIETENGVYYNRFVKE